RVLRAERAGEAEQGAELDRFGDVCARRQGERNVKSVVPDREVRVVTGVERDREACDRRDRYDERHEQCGAVALVGVRETEPEIWVAGERDAAARVAEQGARRERGLP